MKGQIFTPEDAPKSLKGNQEKAHAWSEQQTARYRIVAHDPDARPEKQDIIAEELTARILAKLPPKARRVAPMLMRMAVEDRIAILTAFDETGVLKNPLEMVK